MINLLEASEELVTYLNFYIYEIQNSHDPAQRGSSAMAVSQYYEAVGICELLLDAEIDGFFHHLIRSAQTRKWLFQQALDTEGYPTKVLKASFNQPLFDAIAASQIELAREISKLSPDTYFSDVEYEDDFCYSYFLHRFLLGSPKKELNNILNRFEEVLEGDESPRLDLCRLLLDPDPRASEEAFLGLLEERKEKMQEFEDFSSYSDDALFYPNKNIFIEGLAWLRLLEDVGISMNDEYGFCPSIVRRREYGAFEVTTFPSIPL